MTTIAVLAFPVEERIKKECENSDRKHRFKVNRTNALSMVKEIALKIFLHNKIQPALIALDKILKATIEIIRPNRKFPRKKTKKERAIYELQTIVA